MFPIKCKVKVESVTDGDTIKVLGTSCRARWIDAPEVKKPWENRTQEWALAHWLWGDRSTEFLSQMIEEANREITLYHWGTDTFNRVLSDWYIGQKNLQVELVRAGLAVPFLPIGKNDFYDDRETDLYIALVRVVSVAYREDRGLWKDFKDGTFLLPYDFKRELKK